MHRHRPLVVSSPAGRAAPHAGRVAACAALGLAALAACACAGGQPGTAQAATGDGVVPTTWYAAEFKGGVTRDWFPEDQIDIDNLPKSMVSYEITSDPDAVEPTPEQQARADAFVKASLDAAKRHGWFDYEKGLADGFELMHADPLHYAHREYIMDDELLNPDKPEFLMYYDTQQGKRLAGVMYLTRSNSERGPQFGGPLTIWHYHVWDSPRCLDGELLVCGDPLPGGDSCELGEPLRRSPEMIHVWFFNHPHGPFASTMTLPPQIVQRLEDRGY